MADSTISDQSILISGPSFEIELPALDALFPAHYTRRLLIFRCDSAEQRDAQLKALRSGLQNLLRRCPILGGIIMPEFKGTGNGGHHDWHNIVPGSGIELVVRDLRPSIASFEILEKANFPPTELPYDLLIPFPQMVNSDLPLAACKVQFSAINGGTILAIAISHSVADGSGKNELIRILAEETRTAQYSTSSDTAADSSSMKTSNSDSDVSLDRSLLRNMTSGMPFTMEHHPGYIERYIPPADSAREIHDTTHPFEAASPEAPFVFRIPADKLAELKVDATQPGIPPISTHDALSALLWRSVLFVRSRRSPSAQCLPSTTKGSIFMPSDVRRHVGLPPTYIGNVIYQLHATLDLEILLSASGLQHGASAVRRAITAATPALVTSYLARVNEGWLDEAFWSKMTTTGMGMGSDWKGTSLYEHKWGDAFGRLVRYRYPNEAFNCVFPRLPNGDAEVQVGVMHNEMDLLKSAECLGKYL